MRSWSSVVTVSCLIIVAVVEAWQQALSGSPGVAAIMPRLSGAWNFVPLILLVIAGLSWIAGHIRKLSPAPSASLRPPQAPTPSSVAFGQPSPPIPLSHQGSASALDESSKMVIVQPKGRTLHCESIGITHASAAEDTKAWKAEGAIPAAVVVFRNPTKRTLRNVSGTATFYDSEGRSIARSLLPWLGELRDNTGFLPDQKRAMVVAVRRREYWDFFDARDCGAGARARNGYRQRFCTLCVRRLR